MVRFLALDDSMLRLKLVECGVAPQLTVDIMVLVWQPVQYPGGSASKFERRIHVS